MINETAIQCSMGEKIQYLNINGTPQANVNVTIDNFNCSMNDYE